jgi:peptidoglycan/xylan/chitin deacetylase (PgdA/CDA1 family)
MIASRLVIFGLLSLCAAPALADPVANASFEDEDPATPGQPAHWAQNAWGDTKATFTWQAGGHTGNHCGRVEVSAAGKAGTGDAKWYGDPFVPDSGAGPLQLRDWYRSDVTTHLWVYMTDATEAQAEYVEVATLPAAATWAEASGTVVLPTWATQVRVFHVLEKKGFLEVDDFSALRAVKTGERPLVSIAFDDGWVTAYNMLIPKLDKYGYKATHFIITGYMDKPGYQADYITHKQVKKLLAGGHEVSSHTLLHEDLTLMTDAYLGQNMDDTKVELEKFGVPIVGFAPPYGVYDERVRDRAQQSYSYLRTVKYGLNVPPYKIHELFAVVATWTMKPAELEDLLLEAEYTPGAWLILLYHRATIAADDIPVEAIGAYRSPANFLNDMEILHAHNADVRPVGSILGLWEAQPLPPDPTPPVIEYGKSLPPPTGVTRAQSEENPAQTGSCTARPGGRLSPWLLLVVPGVLWVRRRKLV